MQLVGSVEVLVILRVVKNSGTAESTDDELARRSAPCLVAGFRFVRHCTREARSLSTLTRRLRRHPLPKGEGFEEQQPNFERASGVVAGASAPARTPTIRKRGWCPRDYTRGFGQKWHNIGV